MLNKLKIFGYVRVSTENQLENYSIEEQIARLKAYCAAKDWILLKIYTDGGYSGGNTDRPALKQMLSDLKTTKVDAVLVYKLDRLSRSQKDTLTLIEDEFLANNVDFISINENFDTSTPFGRAMIGILSVFAQLEKDQITERFTMGRIGRSKSGYFHGGGNAPFGYTYENGELIVNETEAFIVYEIYDLFLKGKSINAIYKLIAEKYGGKWSALKVRNILTNVIYIGKVKFAKKEYDGKHTPIIDKKTFESVHTLLRSPKRESQKTASQKTPFRAGYLLSSLVLCDQCGAKYSGGHGYYKCYSRSKNSRRFIKDPNCKNENWKTDDLDKLVISEVSKLAENPVIIKDIKKGIKNENPPVDVDRLAKRIGELDKQISNLVDLYQLGSISMDLLSDKISILNKEKEIIQNKIDTASGADNKSTENFLFSIHRFKEEFESADLETRRLLISSLIKAIHINDLHVLIEWRL